MKQENWLTPPLIAKELTSRGFRVSSVSVRNWIPSVVPDSERVRTPGGHWRVSPNALDRFLNHFDVSRVAKAAKS